MDKEMIVSDEQYDVWYDNPYPSLALATVVDMADFIVELEGYGLVVTDLQLLNETLARYLRES